ncbi:amidohydrolase [Neotabrizicola shimadae]|uniref:Amidohydrolase n=1 Tax=Neotabrizicola shimadae TaxID=2807096 RepID=A0A8G0ZTV0_9RHOB|nr:amidohydrolase [Neotabrizicola shimadae]QYZ69350.1 amidohydrolase [Neotabrizicola shimadae]
MAKADMILSAARVLTLDPARPVAEAVAVGGGRILAVGRADEMEPLVGPLTRHHVLAGKTLLPGLIDSHTHGLWGACQQLYQIFLGLSAEVGAVLEAIAARAQDWPADSWIIAGAWRPNERPALGPCPRLLLDRVANGRPVVVKDATYHNFWLNSAALRAAGIGPATPDPAGGTIERDETGEPTGILIETAGALIQRFLDPSADQLDRAARHMAGLFHSLGLTGFKEPMAFAPELRAYAGADLAGELNLHVAAHLTRFSPASEDWVPMEDLARLRRDHVAPHLHTGFAKLFLDGVPIARTAAFIDPYPGEDPAGHDPERHLLIAPDRLCDELVALDRAGLTVKMHAVGDRAVRAGLDAIAAARRANGFSGLRHEIAHANFIHPDDLPRFAALQAVAEVSPRLWMPNPVTAGQRAVLGDARVETCHPVRSLRAAGAEVVYGSDWPAAVPDANPWIGLVGMITRRDPSGRFPGSVGAAEAIPLAEALPIFTVNGARALGLEGLTGVIRAGASADMVVLDEGLDTMPPEEIAAIRPAATLFEGRVVHGGL